MRSRDRQEWSFAGIKINLFSHHFLTYYPRSWGSNLINDSRVNWRVMAAARTKYPWQALETFGKQSQRMMILADLMLDAVDLRSQRNVMGL